MLVRSKTIFNMKKVYLVLGANGYVGKKFCSFLKEKKCHVIELSHDVMDYTCPKQFEEFIKFNKPRWNNHRVYVINCAGKTGRPNVDECEIKKADTIRLNVVLPVTLSDACMRHGFVFCHVSSGCIYTGTKNRVFDETDAPNFCFNNKNHSFYSGSKALAEELLRNNPQCYIWRIRMPFDEIDSKRNYLSKLIKYDTLIEATNTLTNLNDFFETCHSMLKSDLEMYGVYNIVNDGSITTSEITDLMNEHLGLNKQFKFFETHKHFNETVNTPRSNCVLTCDKVNASPGVTPMPEVRQSIIDVLRNWKSVKTCLV